ncbi:protein-L-isoaspartate (D-aspartate) O-methyltransferase [Aureococcus anophagefferens]|nr:protein-L-isoaspartate (D-aspartate) O-methyltransferase [Aureococcus anophagefferens]
MSIAGSEDSFEEMVPELVAMPPPPPADAEVAEAKAPESGDDDDGEALSDSESDMPNLVSASSGSSSEDDDEGPGPAAFAEMRPPRDSDSESDDDGGEGQRFVRIGRHVLLLGDEGGGDEGLGGRPVRLRTALALVRHMMLANRGSETLEAMVDMLVRERSVSSPPVVAAFRAVDRAAFLPAAVRDEAYVNMPVRHGLVHQSSPSVYGSALEALDLKPGLSFLNVGSGTGYFSALAAQLLGPDAVHVGLERHADLVRHARERCAAAGVVGVCFEVGDVYDLDAAACPRFDRIYVGAGARRDARDLLFRLLRPGGVVVGPFETSGGSPRSDSQKLLRATCCGGGAFALAYTTAVSFAWLHREPRRFRRPAPLALRGPPWDALAPRRRRSAAVGRLGADLARDPGKPASSVPWADVWEDLILAHLPFHAFDAPAPPAPCAARRAPAAACLCGGDALDGGGRDSDDGAEAREAAFLSWWWWEDGAEELEEARRKRAYARDRRYRRLPVRRADPADDAGDAAGDAADAAGDETARLAAAAASQARYDRGDGGDDDASSAADSMPGLAGSSSSSDDSDDSGVDM